MSDHLSAIVNTVNLYAVALDAQRYELFGQVFTSDVRCDFGGEAAFDELAALSGHCQSNVAGQRWGC